MKKHPIDELFAANLKDHNVVPSQRAANLFQQRLAEKKKPKGVFFNIPTRNYYWAAAASVLFVLTIGWYTFQDGQSTQIIAQQKGKIEAVKEIAVTPEAIVAEEELAAVLNSEKTQNVVTNSSQKEKLNSLKKGASPLIQEATESPEKVEKASSPVFTPMVLDEPIMDKLTVAVLDAEREKKKEATKQRKLQTENEDLFKKSIAETVIVISEIQPKIEQLYIPEISGDSRVTIAQATKMGQERQDAERSFIAKVFTEFKHLKHGEKLDVAGLNKKSDAVFTRSEEGFIAAEKEELSYRLGRLKDAFSKNELR
ncbi:MAG: hypothetical protein NWQ46_00475 [Spirosomaceae bacterium]|nr:hypothetical protein [Spirosomataceae bacterium]